MNDPSFSFGGLIGFAALGAAVVFGLKRLQFFEWSPAKWNPFINLWAPLLFFGIYFASSLFAIKYLFSLFATIQLPPIFKMCLLYSFIPFSQLIGFLIGFALFSQKMRLSIWKDPAKPFSLLLDLKASILAWCLAFPVLAFCGNLIALFLYYVFGIQEIPDQAAVLFVKRCLEDRSCFPVLFVTIAIITPLVEEILFRGCLQSFIRKHLGPKSAIWITSLCFAFFHYTPEQKMANLLIIASLFPLALLLGFLYEKRRSLGAPFFLHSLFNGINLFALLFFGETPCGPI